MLAGGGVFRRRKPGRSRQMVTSTTGIPDRRDSSRLSPLVINNPVNQAAHWSQDAFQLQDLVTRFPLPQVVRCVSRLVPGEESHLPINVHVPMLLFAGRTANKLLAKHVGVDSRLTHLMETDDSIVIPSDYDGHFLRLQARTTKDKSVVRHLQYIASSTIPAFINFTPVVSFTQSGSDHHHHRHPPPPRNNPSLDNSDGGAGGSHVSSAISKSSSEKMASGNIRLQKRRVHPPGSVFVVSSTTKAVVKEKRKSRTVVFLRCSDDSGNEVLVPSDQPGEFVEVEVPPNGKTKLSMLPVDLIAANRYPGLVRFVYGDHAPRLTPCSYMFTLIDTFEEDSLIGCMLYPNHALMIELPMTSSLGFQVAMNREEVMAMQLPQHAMDIVRERRHTFVRDLKLKCKFLHRVSSSNANATGGTTSDDDMPSATVRTRQYANEAFFYL